MGKVRKELLRVGVYKFTDADLSISAHNLHEIVELSRTPIIVMRNNVPVGHIINLESDGVRLTGEVVAGVPDGMEISIGISADRDSDAMRFIDYGQCRPSTHIAKTD